MFILEFLTGIKIYRLKSVGIHSEKLEGTGQLADFLDV